MKKTPLRMCIVCREMKPKKDMLRIVKSKDGAIFLDFKGKAEGRGAYICGSEQCIENCIKRKVINKVFSCNVPEQVYQKVREDFFEKQ